jgi:RimJ/RimL family protein N-acetyltransferase
MTIYYLEMHSASEVIAPTGGGATEDPITLKALSPPDGRVNRRFYREVGADWQWTDRAGWSEERWKAYACSGGLVTVLIQHGACDIGYGEIREDQGDVEIVYFGLLPAFVGRGLGGAALTAILRHAWAGEDVKRVWLHTCSADHPHALRNYQRRGLRLFRTESAAEK